MKQEEFWDKRSEKYEKKIRNESFYKKTIEKTRLLLADSDCVLDFACATGELCLDLAGDVDNIHGLDTSKKMIEQAKKKIIERNINNVQFIHGDLNHTDILKHRYSKILAFNILHLVDDVSENITKLFNLLDEGGLLITETPCLGERGWLIKTIIILMQKIGLAPPILNLTYRQLELAFLSHNFEIIENEIIDADANTKWLVAKKK